jgi:predicted dithiol-disulfide oxidoreductase (DUF899 family)
VQPGLLSNSKESEGIVSAPLVPLKNSSFFYASRLPRAAPGVSVFYKDKNANIFHTYSSYARGTESGCGTYNWLDLVPKGPDESELAFTMTVAWPMPRGRIGPRKPRQDPKRLAA